MTLVSWCGNDLSEPLSSNPRAWALELELAAVGASSRRMSMAHLTCGAALATLSA
jgi:hypothetical protein